MIGLSHRCTAYALHYVEAVWVGDISRVYPIKIAHGFHGNGIVVILMIFLSLAALKVVILTTSSAASVENVIKMMTFRMTTSNVVRNEKKKKMRFPFKCCCPVCNSWDLFIHFLQGCFTDTGAIIWLPQCQWSNAAGYVVGFIYLFFIFFISFHFTLCDSCDLYYLSPWLPDSLPPGQFYNCPDDSTVKTSNGSWCIGIKGEMSGTVCVTFTWDIYIYMSCL